MATNWEGSETGNWNMSQDWIRDMIFKPFYEASQYMIIAQTGCMDIEEEFMFDEKTKTKARISGLKWFKIKLEQGIRCTIFAIRNKTDKEKMDSHLNDVISLNDKIHLVESKLTDRDEIKIVINDEYFEIIYNVLVRVFTEVTEPMNKSDLIFSFREQFNSEDFKKKVRDDFVEGD